MAFKYFSTLKQCFPPMNIQNLIFVRNFTKYPNINQIMLNQRENLTIIFGVLGESNIINQKNYKLSGVYVSNRILKDLVFCLNPEKKLGDLNDSFHKSRLQVFKKIKDICDDFDPFAAIGCHCCLFGMKKTVLFFNTLLFDEYCENSIKNVAENSVPNDIINEIFRENELSKLEEILGYKFQNPLYLIQASKIGSNLKLAYIGDAIQDELLLRHAREHVFTNEQFDKCRQAVLNNNDLGVLAVKHGFVKYRIICSGHRNISKKSDATLFEALVGAVYLDSGKNMEIVRRVFYKFLKRPIYAFCKSMNSK